MKKNAIICTVLCFALVFCCLAFPAQAESDQSVLSGCHSTDAAIPLAESTKLLETSKAVILYELNSDTMIYNWNADATIYPSSMVKLMTALIALEYGELSTEVTVTKRALSYVAIGSVSAGLVVGEKLSLESLLYCMMVKSANDAATVIAEHIAGSQDGFLQLMNDKAIALGCKNTHFSNTHGLHDEQTYTTARDLCKIIEAALENPDFRTLFTAKAYTIPETNKSEARELVTSNYMMTKDGIPKYYHKYYDSRVTGGKTGATDAAGRCLVVTAEKNGMNLLAIVMGAVPTYEPDGLSLKTFGSFEEMQVLLNYAFATYEYRQVFLETETVSQYPVVNGTNHVATAPAAALSTVLPIELDTQLLRWVYPEPPSAIQAPVALGQKISTAELWYGNLCLAQTDLIAANAVDIYSDPIIPESPTTPPTDHDGSWLQLLLVLGILLGLALLTCVVVRLIQNRRMRRMLKPKQRRR